MKRGAPSHPKTMMLAMLLGVPLAQAVGHLEMLWHFTAQFSSDGDVGRWSNAIVAQKSGWDGDPEKFINALLEANGGTGGEAFLERTENALLIHDWASHCDDGTHLSLARAGKLFADGSRPKVSRMQASERDEVNQKLDEAELKQTQALELKRTRNAQETLLSTPPSPALALPSPALPRPPSLTPPAIVPKYSFDQAEGIYNAYPVKEARGKAIEKICRCFVKLEKSGVADPVTFLLDKTLQYAEVRRGLDNQFVPAPARWFFEERYNDDPSTWTRGNGGKTAKNASGEAEAERRRTDRATGEFPEPTRTLKRIT